MRSHLKHRVRLTLRTGLAVLAAALPAFVEGQVSAAAAPPFAGIDNALVARADALLSAPAVDHMPAVSAPANEQNVANHARPDTRRGNIAAMRLQKWRPVVAPILEDEGVPSQLAAVILVESGGDPAALSPKGARGLWQLMPETARRYGLLVGQVVDERLNVEKSTRTAARYLRDLYGQFGSWPLALAAYNTGEQNLQRAIDSSGASDFSALSSRRLLPFETRNYVPAVLAAAQLTPRSFSLDSHHPPAEKIVFAPNHQ